MKYVILVGDGMADRPLKKLGGKTPLEAARTPNMDFIARNGVSGMVSTIPHGMQSGSDVANLSLFGYDPKKYYTGRGPLEAISRGIKLRPRDVAFRCNTVKIEGGRMADYSAGHISTAEAAKVIRLIDKELGDKKIRFFPGVSYRHLCVIEGGPDKAKCTPPHDISGKPIAKYLPKGKGAEPLNILMEESMEILSSRKFKANMVWLWGQGKTPRMPRFPLKGSVITAVDLIKGIGLAIGLKVINVPGATGYLDTNYLGKANHALRSLEKNDFVFVHVESPDEAGHEGNVKHKIRAIEDFDRFVVGTVLKGLKKLSLSGAHGFRDFKLMVLPDHPTPVSLKTHSSEPVPFAIYSSGGRGNGCSAYSEREARRTGLVVPKGHDLIRMFTR